MNYLAHLFLAEHASDDFFAGNYMGDGFRGNDFSKHPAETALGVKYHRGCDVYTDSHTLLREIKDYFSPEFGLYAGIVSDLAIDFYFAESFEKITQLDLHKFAQESYHRLSGYIDLMPTRSAEFYYYMTKYNILFHYQHEQGQHKVLDGFTHRIGKRKDLTQALPIIKNESLLKDACLQFMHEVITSKKILQ